MEHFLGPKTVLGSALGRRPHRPKRFSFLKADFFSICSYKYLEYCTSLQSPLPMSEVGEFLLVGEEREGL